MPEELSQSRLNQILLDNLPCVALLLRASTWEIVASNQAAVKVGAIPGSQCFATLVQRNTPCPWCLAPKLRQTGEAQQLEVEIQGTVWEAHWVPVGPDLFLHYAFDITDRRRTEQAQRECERKYRNLFEESFDGLFITSATGKILDINKKGVAMFGYDTKEEMLSLNLTRDVYAYPQDHQRITSLIKAQGTGDYEVIVKKKNGAKMMARCSMTAERDKQGKTVSYRGIIRDITERKLAEEELAKNHRELQKTAQRLEQSRNMLQQVIESIPVRVFWKDRESRFMGCNTLFARDAGLGEPRQLLGKDDFAMGWRDQAECYQADDRQVIDSHRPKMNILEPQTTPTGAKIWLNTSKVPLESPDGEVFGVLGVYEDITERKQAEEALRQAHETLRATLDAAPVAIFDLDLEGRVKSLWNAAAERMLGWRREEVLGRLVPTITEDNREEFDGYLRWINSGKSLMGKDVVRRRKDGSPIEFSIYAAPEYDDRGQVAGHIGVLVDITERLRMERALQESEKKYHDLYNLTRLIVDNVPDLIWAKGMDNEFILVNQAICQKLLMIDHPEEALGKPHGYFANKEWQAGFDHDFGDTCSGSDDVVKETGVSGRFLESGVVRGQKIVLDVYKAPLFNEEGKLIGTVGCGRDVTKEKEIEEALRQSEEKYRLLVNQIPAVVFRGYGDWSIEVFDDKIEALTGYRKEDFNSRRVKWCDLIPAEDLEGIRQRFSEALHADKSCVQEHRLRRKDGELIWIQCRGQLFTDASGNLDYISGMSFDVTDRKRAELALQESEQKLAEIIDFLPDATLVIDKEGQVIAWNRALEEMTGIKSAEMMGKGHYEHALPFYGKRRPMLLNLLLKPGEELAQYTELQKEGLSLSGVAHFPSLQGKEVYLFVKAGILLDSQGNLVGAIESMRDVTDRHRALDERLRFSKLESLGLLAGGIAHDFNNILTAIIGNISLAMLDIKQEEQIYETLSEAEIACQQAQNLARQLLTFAKGGAPIKKITSLATLINNSVMLACRGTCVRCEILAPEDLWLVEADPGQLGQVLQNLLINAIQAMPAGGNIGIEAANVDVETTDETLPKPGKYVKVIIRDQGIGIPAEHLPKVFDPYFTTKQSGSGLGLATAYSIIKNHQGKISVESTLGVGTTFSILLPANKQEGVPQVGKDGTVLRGAGKILAMDDEEIVRKVLAKMLTNLGYEVELAQDGAEALKTFTAAVQRGEKFTAVILDLTVPGGLGGKETMAKLLKIDPQVKALVSSGYSDDPIMADPQRYGFSGVITKPYRVLEISKILHDLIVNQAKSP